MPDTDCENACIAAYTAHVGTCNDVLRANLIDAKTDADRQEAKDEFLRCMALTQETKALCLQACGD